MEDKQFETKKSGTLSRAFSASAGMAGTISDYRGMPRRMATFTVDHTMCLPGVFDQDFELTIATLTAAIETAGLNQSKGDPVTMGMSFAKLSIVALDGEPVTPDQGKDDWLWEVLGPAGRQLVTVMYAQIGSADADAIKKAQQTLRLH